MRCEITGNECGSDACQAGGDCIEVECRGREGIPWVPCSERLPQDDKEYLVWRDAACKPPFALAYFESGRWENYFTGGYINDVTHWAEVESPAERQTT